MDVTVRVSELSLHGVVEAAGVVQKRLGVVLFQSYSERNVDVLVELRRLFLPRGLPRIRRLYIDTRRCVSACLSLSAKSQQDSKETQKSIRSGK